jgi:hypothetical protein
VQQDKWIPDGEAGCAEFHRLRTSHPEIVDDFAPCRAVLRSAIGRRLTLMAQVDMTAAAGPAAPSN